jgi:hypothetical protein
MLTYCFSGVLKEDQIELLDWAEMILFEGLSDGYYIGLLSNHYPPLLQDINNHWLNNKN